MGTCTINEIYEEYTSAFALPNLDRLISLKRTVFSKNGLSHPSCTRSTYRTLQNTFLGWPGRARKDFDLLRSSWQTWAG